MSANLATALAAFQAELPKLRKGNKATVRSDKGNYTYRYADLAYLSGIVLPALAKHGLSFSAKPTLDGDKFVLEYALRHTSGDEVVGKYPLPTTGTAQSIGSAITYARRYALCALTGIAPDEDRDGSDVVHDAEPRRPVAAAEWDPGEQQVLLDSWTHEISKAKTTAETSSIATTLLKAKRAGSLSPNTYDRLVVLGGRRAAELAKESTE